MAIEHDLQYLSMVWILRSAPLLLPRPRSACTWAALISENWVQLICLIAIVSWTLLQRLHKTEPNLQTLLQRLPARCSAATSFFAQRSMVCLYNALFNDISITDARWFALVATHALWCGASGLWNNMWANPPPLFEQHFWICRTLLQHPMEKCEQIPHLSF